MKLTSQMIKEKAKEVEAAKNREAVQLEKYRTRVRAMEENGISLVSDEPLTRADAAQVLYRVSRLCATAPGMAVIRMQQ